MFSHYIFAKKMSVLSELRLIILFYLSMFHDTPNFSWCFIACIYYFVTTRKTALSDENKALDTSEAEDSGDEVKMKNFLEIFLFSFPKIFES